jgi:malate dehydrogenase (oxaloacetate-decarboxylating)
MSGLELDRPLAVLDLETTGTDLHVDRIVEIAIVRIGPQGKAHEFHSYVDPQMRIPQESSLIHGITDERVLGAPTFDEIADRTLDMLGGAILAGYNHVRFDLPMLQREFQRAGIRWEYDGIPTLDAQTIFHGREPRDLTAAYRFYCDRDLVGAHGALADARATAEVIFGELRRYRDLPRSVLELVSTFAPKENRYVDSGRRFAWRHGEPHLNFGERRGASLRSLVDEDPEFLDWILERDFPRDTKTLVRNALQGTIPIRDPLTGEIRTERFTRAADAKTGSSAGGDSRAADTRDNGSGAADRRDSPSTHETDASRKRETVYERSLELHRKTRGKIETRSRMRLETIEDLCLAYSPGVARPSEEIARQPRLAWDLTWKGRTVAIVSDGSAVLGLGDIGPLAALPVMEGKAALFRALAGVDAVPVVLEARDPERIVEVVRAIAPSYGGINLEDISAPRAFEIEDRLQDIGIPVLHDDQHGTAIVILAAVANAARALGRSSQELSVVISGAGAAGRAVARLLLGQDGAQQFVPVRRVLLCDSRGVLAPGREGQDLIKEELARLTNPDGFAGSIRDALYGADVFIGLSRGNLIGREDVQRMAADPIVLALANPTPEIDPEEAKAGGAAIIGTGRSDYPNQVNNVLVFPGLFRGALDSRALRFTPSMKLAAVSALIRLMPEPTRDRILPSPLDRSVPAAVARAVARAAREDGVCA